MTLQSSTGLVVVGAHLALDFLAFLMIVQYYRRRNFQPIRSRLYWQPIIISVLLLATMFYAACATEFEAYISCEAYLLLFVLVFNSMVPILFRATQVYSAYEVSKVYAKGGSMNYEQAQMTSGNIFLRRAELIHSFKVQSALFIILCVVHLLAWAAYTQLLNPTCNGLDELLAMAALSSGYCLCTLYLGWNLATLKDGLYIRRELVLVACGGVFALPFYVGLRIAFDSYYYANLVIAFGPYWVVGVEIGMPLYKSYVWQRLRNSTEMEEPATELTISNFKSDDSKSQAGSIDGTRNEEVQAEPQASSSRGPAALIDLLNNKKGNALFLEFSRLELNHENVLFYNEVSEFLTQQNSKPDLGREDFDAICWKIFNRFISPQAKLEVNVGAKERRFFDIAGFDVEDGAIARDDALRAFGVVRNEVIILMYKDVYPRFLRTAVYAEFAAILDNQAEV